MSLLTPPHGYVRIFKNRLLLQIPGKEHVVEKAGHFSHRRMLVSEITEAEILLREAIREAYPQRLRLIGPSLIIHPMELTEGGITAIEQRLLEEITLGAGAHQCHIWLGPDLSAQEVQNFVF